MFIRVQTERAYVEIDRVRHYVSHSEAKFVEMLLNARGDTVAHEQLRQALSKTRGAVQVYAAKMRAILSPCGVHIVNNFGMGYRIVTSGPIVYRIVIPSERVIEPNAKASKE